MNFNLNDAPEPNFNNAAPKAQYIKPGIYENVKITKVNLGLSSLNKIPFIELLVVGEKGELGKSNRMWLSTTIGVNLDGTPKKTSGWGVTQRNIIDLLMATHNITRDQAKVMLDINEEDKEKARQMLANKLSALLIGHPFRAKFKGNQAKPREDGTPGLIFATMDLVESTTVPKAESVLRFDPSRDVVLYNTPTVDEIPTEKEPAGNDDLPF